MTKDEARHVAAILTAWGGDSVKFCSRCKRTKRRSRFGPHKLARDGLQYWCRSCKSDYAREYRKTRAYKASAKAQEARQKRLYPERVKARSLLQQAVFYGKVVRPEICSSCEQENGIIHGHHEDSISC